MDHDWSPCKIIDYSAFLSEDDMDHRYGLLFDEFGPTQAFLEAQGFMAGGYTWHGIVESMIRAQDPAMGKELDFDPESSMFCVRSSNIDVLKLAHDCISRAIADEKILQKAIDTADPLIME